MRGVSHSLHSSLLSITNVISGMTAVGGMFQLDGGLLPYTTPQTLAMVAVTLSVINLIGGSHVTPMMVEMFRNKDVSSEY